MCASYGLDPRFPGYREYRRGLISLATLEGMAAWATSNEGRTIRPTGKNARNLNPIIRDTGLELAWWGYGPTGVPPKYPTINARSETLMSRATWKRGYRERRGLAPLTEWFEYDGTKTRWSFATGELLMVGTVTAAATIEEGPVTCYSLIMQPAPEHLAHIHDRMPVLITPDLVDDWLDPAREGDEELLSAALASSLELAGSVTPTLA